MWEGGGTEKHRWRWRGGGGNKGGGQEAGKARGEDAVSDETGVDDKGRRRLKEDEEAGVRGIQHRHDKMRRLREMTSGRG